VLSTSNEKISLDKSFEPFLMFIDGQII